MSCANSCSLSGDTAGIRAPGFWRRRVVRPLLDVLRQGTSPDALARTIATGTVCSLFPFLGATTALNILVGWWKKLNQPILQALNQLLGPVQLALILVYVRAGEWIWGDAENAFSLADMVEAFRELSISEFLRQFGWAGAHAFTAWALSAPILYFAVYAIVRPLTARLARQVQNAK